MSSLLSSDEKNEEVKSNLIYDANLEGDRNNEQPDSKDDAVYLGLIIFGSVVFALGKTYNVKIPLRHRILGKPSLYIRFDIADTSKSSYYVLRISFNTVYEKTFCIYSKFMQNTSFSQHKHKNETQIAYYVANLCSCTKGNGYIYFSYKIVI